MSKHLLNEILGSLESSQVVHETIEGFSEQITPVIHATPFCVQVVAVKAGASFIRIQETPSSRMGDERCCVQLEEGL